MAVPLAEATEVLDTLSALVKLGRRTRRWSQEELADRAGVSKRTIRKVENGDPTVAIGTYLNASVLVGVPLLGPDEASREAVSQLVDAKLAFLPARIHAPKVSDDF